MPELTSAYVSGRDLLKRLQEPAPGRIQLLTGPRQVGKGLARRHHQDDVEAGKDMETRHKESSLGRFGTLSVIEC
jgi:hypothetical protein